MPTLIVDLSESRIMIGKCELTAAQLLGSFSELSRKLAEMFVNNRVKNQLKALTDYEDQLYVCEVETSDLAKLQLELTRFLLQVGGPKLPKDFMTEAASVPSLFSIPKLSSGLSSAHSVLNCDIVTVSDYLNFAIGSASWQADACIEHQVTISAEDHQIRLTVQSTITDYNDESRDSDNREEYLGSTARLDEDLLFDPAVETFRKFLESVEDADDYEDEDDATLACRMFDLGFEHDTDSALTLTTLLSADEVQKAVEKMAAQLATTQPKKSKRSR